MKPVPFTSLRVQFHSAGKPSTPLSFFLKYIFYFYKVIHSYYLKKSNSAKSVIVETNLLSLISIFQKLFPVVVFVTFLISIFFVYFLKLFLDIYCLMVDTIYWHSHFPFAIMLI